MHKDGCIKEQVEVEGEGTGGMRDKGQISSLEDEADGGFFSRPGT